MPGGGNMGALKVPPRGRIPRVVLGAFLLSILTGCAVDPAHEGNTPKSAALTGEIRIVNCRGNDCGFPADNDLRWTDAHLGPDGIRGPFPFTEGISWITLTFSVDPTAFPSHPSILLTRPGDAEEVYLNGMRVGGEGFLGPAYVVVPPGPRLVKIPPQALRPGRNELAMRVLFAARDAGAFRSPILLGESDVLAELAERIRGPIILGEAAFLSAFLVVIVFFVFLIMRGEMETEYLLFTLSMALFAADILLEGNLFHRHGLPGQNVQRLLTILSFVGTPVMVALVTIATGGSRGWLFLFLMAVSVAFAAISAVLPPLAVVEVLAPYDMAFRMGLGIYYVYLCWGALFRRDWDSIPILIGVLGYAVGSRIELFWGLGYKRYGVLVFSLGMLFALASRYARTRTRMAALAEGVVKAHEEERRRIARDLHDTVGQSLLALRLRLKMLAAKGDPRDGVDPDSLNGLAEDARLILEDVRRAALDLRPSFAETTDLPDLLKAYVLSLNEKTGLDIVLHEPAASTGEVPLQVKENLYRICQEALTNATKHAAGSRIEVSLYGSDGRLHLEVADDGKGVTPPDEQGKGIGISTMRERAEILGGTFSISGRHGGGTVVRVEVPAQ